MKVVKRVLWVLVLGLGVGCGVGCAAEAAPSRSELTIAQVEQAITIFDCQAELGMCVRQARGLRGLAECSTAFATCNTQAANDLLDETQVLNDCRAEATACLNTALTTADVRACRGLFSTCSEDALASAEDALNATLDTARDAIQNAADGATTVITNAAGIGSDAFGVLQQCRDDAETCLDGVTGSTNVGACRAIFDNCADGAVDLVDGAVRPVTSTAGDVIVCNAQFSTCVLGLNSPFDCAADAQMCLGL